MKITITYEVSERRHKELSNSAKAWGHKGKNKVESYLKSLIATKLGSVEGTSKPIRE